MSQEPTTRWEWGRPRAHTSDDFWIVQQDDGAVVVELGQDEMERFGRLHLPPEVAVELAAALMGAAYQARINEMEST